MSDLMFLPAPRLPSLPREMDAATVAAVVGDELAAPLLAVEEAHAAAQAALADLAACRPNVPGTLSTDGVSWRAAVDADAAAAVEAAETGTMPKVWQTERLLRDDSHRWSTALAACKAFPRIRARLDQQVNRDAIAERAEMVAESHAATWSKAAEDGWTRRPRRGVAAPSGRGAGAGPAPAGAVRARLGDRDAGTAGRAGRGAAGRGRPAGVSELTDDERRVAAILEGERAALASEKRFHALRIAEIDRRLTQLFEWGFDGTDEGM